MYSEGAELLVDIAFESKELERSSRSVDSIAAAFLSPIGHSDVKERVVEARDGLRSSFKVNRLVRVVECKAQYLGRPKDSEGSTATKAKTSRTRGCS